VERLFGRFAPWFLLFTPGWLTSALAGMSGVSRARCYVLNALGVTGWAATYHQLGGWLEPWTAPFTRFLRENLLLATLVCVALVAAYQGYSVRKRRAARSSGEPRTEDETRP
jgi:membrane protein DedA with SNARE-associated domain